MDIEKELKDILKNYQIEKKLDDIKDLLLQKELGQYDSTGFWLFALLLVMMWGGFGMSTPTTITNIYPNNMEDKKNESSV